MDPLSIASAGFGIASGVAGIFGSRKAKKAARRIRAEQGMQTMFQKNELQLNQRRQDVAEQATNRSNILSMVDQERMGRIRRSEMLNAAGAAGAGLSSSAVQTGLDNVSSQIGRNVGMLNDMSFFQEMDKDIVDRLQGLQTKTMDSQMEVAKQQSKLGGGGLANTLQQASSMAADFSRLFAGSDLFKMDWNTSKGSKG